MLVKPLGLWRETHWVQILDLPLYKCINLGKLLNCSDPKLSVNKVDIIIMPIK